MQTTRVPIDSLVFDPANARKHGERNLEAIKGSLARFGQQKPIVVGSDNVVYAGNGTLAAARALGWTEIDVVRTELTGPEATAFALADNRTSELAEWDTEILSKTLESLRAIDFDVASIGFDDDFMVPTPPVTEGLTDPDAVPEQVETRCKPGDMWVLGKHRLLCGDSTNVQHVERLMGGEKADIVFTDPPYGMNLDTDFSTMGNDRVLPGKKHRAVQGDNADFDPAMIFGFFGYCAEIILFGADYFADRIPDRNDGSWLVWDKRVEERYDAVIGSAFEMIWSKKRRKREIIRFEYASWGARMADTVGGHKAHPTMKPIGLLLEVLKRADGALVADLFLGSGSTLIACEKTGRRCFGMVLDPEYCDVILARWEAFTGQTAIRLDGSETETNGQQESIASDAV